MKRLLLLCMLLSACVEQRYATATLYCPGAPPLSIDSVRYWDHEGYSGKLVVYYGSSRHRSRVESPSCSMRWGRPNV